MTHCDPTTARLAYKLRPWQRVNAPPPPHRLSKLYEEGRMSHEQASLVKAWSTARGREVVALGRELLGGNGILSHFHVAKAFCDLEAIYTYEVRCICSIYMLAAWCRQERRAAWPC